MSLGAHPVHADTSTVHAVTWLLGDAPSEAFTLTSRTMGGA